MIWRATSMRTVVVSVLLLALIQPLLVTSILEESDSSALFSDSSGVEVVDEIEPNNVNTSAQVVYPGDVVKGGVDMWDDKHDWFTVWLEADQTMLLTLSHASGDGVSMSVWDEEGKHVAASNPSKTRDTIFLGEDENDMNGAYTVSINATMTEAGGGAYVLEIDAGYEVHWYSPEVGWYAASEQYNAKGELMYTSSLSSYQFANENSTDKQLAPIWTTGDYWNYSVTMPEIFGTSYDEYYQMTVADVETVAGKECFKVSIDGKSTLNINVFGMSTTTTDEQSGVACYAKDNLALLHENLTFSSTFETGNDFMTMSTSARSCTTSDWGEPDEDCDDVEDDFDTCPGTAPGAEVDDFGCSEAQNNDDNNGSGDGSGNGNGDGNNGGGNGGVADADNDGVVDGDDFCPDTPSGENVDASGCSDSQNGGSGDGNNGGGSGDGNGGGNGGGSGDGFGGLDGICIPSATDMSQKTEIQSDLTFSNGINQFNFPLVEGKVWSEAAAGSGTISISIEFGGCALSAMSMDDSGSLPLNYRHLNDKSFNISESTVTATGIQVFSGREGNNDWATPDFTILESVPDSVAKMGLPFAVWIDVVGFNEFNSSVNISASISGQTAAITYDNQQLSIGDLGAVVVDTANLPSAEYDLIITGESQGMERSVTVSFTVDNDPDFEILTLDPWIVVPSGVQWVVPTPIFIEPVNGFGADVSIAATVPEGVTAQLDFAKGTAPFMAVLTLTIPGNISAGDYTVIVTGKSGSNVHSDEITFTVTSLPEFSLNIENREQLISDGTMSISGVINAHNDLDLSLGGVLDVLVEPYNQALLDSAVITWGEIDGNGDLPFTVTFTVDENTPRNEYTVQLNVASVDGGITHAASVAFVTESSTLDGTAVAADASAVVSGNTSQHDGTDTSAQNIAEGKDGNSGDGDDDSDSKSSNTKLIVGSTIGVLLVGAVIAFIVMKGKNSGAMNKDFNQQMWANQGTQMMPNQVGYAQPDMGLQPGYEQIQQPVQPLVQQPVQSMDNSALQVATAPAPPAATAPAPPAQPTTVTDYTGLPPGGQYDQSTGQTIYVQADGVRWQMMPDGSFNRLN